MAAKSGWMEMTCRFSAMACKSFKATITYVINGYDVIAQRENLY